jgi:predicted NUDIX family NTP pyrophosphohydrolase
MAKPKPVSAGTLLYKKTDRGVEVLLVHPSGAYNVKSPWSIPKGLPDEGEALESAARRETLEETGVQAGALVPLGSVDYTKSRKTVVAFAGPLPEGAEPRCASWEVDRAELVSIERASELLQADQVAFLARLAALLLAQNAKAEPPP